MPLRDLTNQIADVTSWNHVTKIKFFAWYLHTQQQVERFQPAAIAACYDELHLEKPSSISPIISGLTDKKPKEMLKDTRGYYLAKHVRDDFDTRYGQREATVMVDKLLSDLPGKISDQAERVYLSEALICFRHRAFRAAIVMCWNVAYHHLEDWIFDKHLVAFNTSLAVKYPRARVTSITSKEHFAEFKESEIIETCRHANIISNDVNKVLKEKLDKRNTAAHPSKVEITQLTAEEFIRDLVSNVVLKLT